MFAAYHLPYWQTFLTLCGMEAVTSDATTQEMADRGGRLIPPEFCIPVKVFMGHVLNLLEKGVAQILLPRMTAAKKANFFCPKFIGLPEIVRFTMNLEERMFFAPEMICNGLNPKLIQFPTSARASWGRMRQAENQARECWQRILENCRKYRITLPEASAVGPTAVGLTAAGPTVVGSNALGTGVPATGGGVHAPKPQNRLTVGLLGYAYSVYDPFISKGLLGKLGQLQMTATTWEMLEPALIDQSLAGLKRPLFWNYGRMLLGAGLHFLADPAVDGIIYVSTFGCGPDSVATEILNIEADHRHKPFLLINLDDHTEDAHLFTRLEAFADMLAALKEEQAV